MKNYIIGLFLALTLVGCGSRYQVTIDEDGGSHCRDTLTGRFVDDSRCE